MIDVAAYIIASGLSACRTRGNRYVRNRTDEGVALRVDLGTNLRIGFFERYRNGLADARAIYEECESILRVSNCNGVSRIADRG